MLGDLFLLLLLFKKKKSFPHCDRVSLCNLGCSGTQYIAEAGPKLEAILLPQPSKCWDYRNIRLCLAYKLALNLWFSWSPNARIVDLYYQIWVILSGRLYMNILGHFFSHRSTDMIMKPKKEWKGVGSLSSTSVPELKHRLPDLAISTLTHWAPH